MKRPQQPLISTPVNLSNILLDEMYVGFTAATGRLVQYHRVLAWSFSNSNASIEDSLTTLNLPRERAEMEDWELEYWPHRMNYQEIHTMTKGLSEESVIAHETNEAHCPRGCCEAHCLRD
uniref:Legume lectin domain-containing protein n=1 Tax=Nelumbo nucifera TaxID=4432 RepID=A0A822Z7Y9_NELNU|nr:TPA_asm: hypothetical protein HUJ06_008239 [Nelumbo nucifera]